MEQLDGAEGGVCAAAEKCLSSSFPLIFPGPQVKARTLWHDSMFQLLTSVLFKILLCSFK